MSMKKIGVLLVSLLFILFFSIFVTGEVGMGLTPPITELTYGVDSLENVKFTVMPKGEDWVKIFVTGPIDIKDFNFHDIENLGLVHLEGRKDIVFDINVNEEELIPGDHKIKVYVAQTDPPSNPDGSPYQRPSGIVARVAVAHVIKLFVPYDGHFLRMTFDQASSIKKGGKVFFKLTLDNVGKGSLINQKVNIKVFNNDNKEVASLVTDEVTVESFKSKEVFAEWDSKENPVGTYTAKATATYGDEVREVERTFLIGDILVEIENVNLNTSNNVGKITLDVASKWNEIINDASVQIDIKSGNNVVKTINSETFNLDPWEIKPLELFFEKNNLQIGVYTADINVNYVGKTTTKTVEFYLTQDAVIEKPATVFSTTNFLLAVIIILLVFFVSISFMYLKELKQKK